MEVALLYPMFAMVVLTFTVLVSLFTVRFKSVANGVVPASYFRTYSTGVREPESSVQLARHFTNLFEAPVLFYVGCVAIMTTGTTDTLSVGIAWAYVFCRVVHAVVHVGSNRLRPRIAAYFTSWIALLALWVVLLLRAG